LHHALSRARSEQQLLLLLLLLLLRKPYLT
jgi:hypothetical protein